LERSVYTVGQLNGEIKNLVESSYRSIWVEGEISGLSRPASGHIYFSLKEECSLIRCAYFRNRQIRGSFIPAEGAQVLLQGQISYYEPRGDLQLIVSYVEESGEGALRRAFEMRKKKLLAEGLFEQQAKQPVPDFPNRVGIVTSESGAVLHDILTTLKRRCPSIGVILYPTQVQGPDASAGVSNMIDLAGQRNECDVLVVARGGGSLDDLQAFNSETVARSIHQCPIPVISAVGHETDISISDFVADVRAPTPTAAAEMLSPDNRELARTIKNHELRVLNLIESLIITRRQTIDYLGSRLIHPGDKLQNHRKQRQHLVWQLTILAKKNLTDSQSQLKYCINSLKLYSPDNKVLHIRQTLTLLSQALLRNTENKIDALANTTTRIHGNITLMGPQNTLERGYAIVQNGSRKVVTRHHDLVTGEPLEITVSTGKFNATVAADA
jgi:exodeoxyribonuclease VII large subunit